VSGSNDPEEKFSLLIYSTSKQLCSIFVWLFFYNNNRPSRVQYNAGAAVIRMAQSLPVSLEDILYKESCYVPPEKYFVWVER
jgi:hypothetical protein